MSTSDPSPTASDRDPTAAEALGAALSGVGDPLSPLPPEVPAHDAESPAAAPTLGSILRTWWPLAASWFFMSSELPALVAVVARMPDAAIHLAAYGGVVFPLALIIESPVIQLLAASTALSRDRESYATLRRYMMAMGAALTALHLALALTPLFDVVVGSWLGIPEELHEPSRIGLLIMTPWTWAIAYRRFQQGVLIRFGRARAVGLGTAVRLSTVGLVLAAGFLHGDLPGIVVGTLAIASGVTMEAIFSGLAVRSVRRGPLERAPLAEPPLRWPSFMSFYTPLVLTSLLILLAQPIGSAAMGRLPLAVASLAVWPAIGGLSFLMRSFGIAYTEVVVAMLDEPGAIAGLRRFAGALAAGSTLFAAALTVTPLAEYWLGDVSALPPDLVAMGGLGLWFMLPLPALSVAQAVYQGVLVHGRATRGVTEAVALYLAVSGVLLWGWIQAVSSGSLPPALGALPGIYVALVVTTIATAAQTAWLLVRARPLLDPSSSTPT